MLLSRAQIKYIPKDRNKLAEQPFMTNPEITSCPTDLEGLRLLMGLQTSASETGARDKNLED
jgi:hypothetical protein